ncbi:hypothetical protein [Janthinobacterium sp. GMG1]|uniref:hypothetical protein n=1 Tax=Janthinobacterium sp. GMG1 TaxID=3096007 RepID=UPI002ACA24B5|nr:hypothetical protein [Janthinobacterium sp. GMG1]MDZ5634495.1 hypothetical protein [Janthinobacterium sp. GMG1]
MKKIQESSAICRNAASGPLKKGDLQFQYPNSTTQGDDPSMRGTPDSDELNRHEWYEVLYFCNEFSLEFEVGNKQYALKAERIIHDYLPPTIRSRKQVKQFLIDNWHRYH